MVHKCVWHGCAGAAAAVVVLSVACSDPNGGSGKPVARFSAVCAALRCDFTDESTDNEAISAWEWNFGDNATATEQNPFHLYAEPGMYDVSLTVRDANGVSDTQNREVTTTPPVVGE